MPRNHLLLTLGLLAGLVGIATSRGSSPASPNAPQTPPEISTHDDSPNFTLQTERNTVLVPVIVRNAKGEAIDNLSKEDFRLFDRGKPQPILSFAIQKPSTAAKSLATENPGGNTIKQSGTKAVASGAEVAPDRYVALFFDDITASEQELAQTRTAAAHYLSTSVLPNERIGLFTASGRKQVDFTSDMASIQGGLVDLHTHQDTALNSTPPYLAYLRVENDQGPFNPYTLCGSNQDCITGATKILADARTSMEFSNSLSTRIMSGLQSMIGLMNSLPGQRTLVIVSPGFQTFSVSLRPKLEMIVDSAIRAHVVINALDARGVYGDVTITDDLFNSQPMTQDELAAALIVIAPILREGARHQTEAMKTLSHDTGGSLFENSNDFASGIRQTTGAPEALYLLSFSPQNLRHDGAFHDLKVSLVSSHGLSLQSRHGYFAPPKSEDPASQEKEEIREAVFSLEEAHTLPARCPYPILHDLGDGCAAYGLTRLDLNSLRFLKPDDRNYDKLTIATVIFDQDGHVVECPKKCWNCKCTTLFWKNTSNRALSWRASLMSSRGSTSYGASCAIRKRPNCQLKRTWKFPIRRERCPDKICF